MRDRRPPPRRLGFKRFAAMLLTAWLFLILLQTHAPKRAEATLAPKAGRADATISELPLLDGETWRLADHRGKVVLVNLWATWCPPCRSETPALVRIAQDLRADGLEVLGVSMDRGSPEPIRRFAKDYEIPYAIARGVDERSFSLGLPLPTTSVYDRRGKLAITAVGAIDEKPFRETLRTLLAEKEP